MTPENRQPILVGVMLVMLTAIAAWSLSTMFASRSDAMTTAQSVSQTKLLAEQIVALRTEDNDAQSQGEASQQDQALRQRIQLAAGRAGLAADGPWLESVDPRAPSRVGDTPYQRLPTEVRLRGVPMRQLVTLLFHLTDKSNLEVHELRLTPADAASDQNIWDADATLTHLIYSPIATTR